MPQDIGTTIYKTQIPLLTDSADIQQALRLYHYGQASDPGATLGNTSSIAGYLADLETRKANLAGATFTGDLITSSTTASTTTTTGSFKCAGGAGIVGNANIGGNLSVTGTATIGGTLVYHISNYQPTIATNNYTVILSDDGKMLEANSTLANTVTIPTDATTNFTIGSIITVLQIGVGQTSIVGASGVTVNGTPGLKLRAQWSSVQVIKRAANTWVVIGDLSA